MKGSTKFLIVVIAVFVAGIVILAVISNAKKSETEENTSTYAVTENTESTTDPLPVLTTEEVEEYNARLVENRSKLDERFNIKVYLNTITPASDIDPSMEQCIEYGMESSNEASIKRIVAYLAESYGGESTEYGCDGIGVDEESLLSVFHLYGPNGTYDVILNGDSNVFYVEKTSNTGKVIQEETEKIEMTPEMREQYNEILEEYGIRGTSNSQNDNGTDEKQEVPEKQ